MTLNHHDSSADKRHATALGRRKYRILYVQHAGSPGGSAISLRNTIGMLDRCRFEPVVALVRPSDAMVQLYERENIEVVEWPGIVTLEHTTAFWTSLLRPLTWLVMARTLLRWRRSERRTLELLEKVRPDIVHLNSVVLLPSARALRKARQRFVWHVRESPVTGRKGFRFRYQRRALRDWTPEVIFLSRAEKELWGGRPGAAVVPNFVDDSRYRELPSKTDARNVLGLAASARVILYVGGLGLMKGIIPLLEALALLRAEFPGLVCLMPAAGHTPSKRFVSRIARRILPIFGHGTLAQQVDALIARHGLESVCHRLPFAERIESMYAACDVVLFPALLNHFARPAIEAGAARRPIVASNLPSVAEVVEDGRTGLLFEPGDPRRMAAALARVLSDDLLAERLGRDGRRVVEGKYAARSLVARIEECYQRLLVQEASARSTVPGQDSGELQGGMDGSASKASARAATQ